MCVCSLREKLKWQYYGGELVDQAVNAVFAALIWHCQDLREELTVSGSLASSQLLQDAFSTAEALRRDLVFRVCDHIFHAYCPTHVMCRWNYGKGWLRPKRKRRIKRRETTLMKTVPVSPSEVRGQNELNVRGLCLFSHCLL